MNCNVSPNPATMLDCVQAEFVVFLVVAMGSLIIITITSEYIKNIRKNKK